MVDDEFKQSELSGFQDFRVPGLGDRDEGVGNGGDIIKYNTTVDGGRVAGRPSVEKESLQNNS